MPIPTERLTAADVPCGEQICLPLMARAGATATGAATLSSR
jgi:hypothetical protein